MRRQILSCIIVGLLIVAPSFAQRVSNQLAEKVALSVLSAQNRENNLDCSSKKILNVIPLGKNDTTMYMVSSSYNWVLIAGDMRVTPILAYSDENNGPFSSDDMPPAMVDLLDWYDAQIAYVRDSSAERDIHPEWSNILNGIDVLQRSVIVSPLLYRNGLENLWGQYGNNESGNNQTDITRAYNKFCPLLPVELPLGSSYCHTPAGCVAVSTSQIMWYWQWPNSGIVLNDNGDTLVRQYDWTLMPTKLMNSSSIEQADMIATLLHDVGESVHMHYGCTGSGAYADSAAIVLTHNFDYLIDGLFHRLLFNHIWIERLKTNLNEQKPVIYGGNRLLSSGGTVGHQFVLDGYDSTNKFHANFGWMGTNNGYYLLDSLGQAGQPYNISQYAIFNIRPNYPSCDDWTDLPIDTFPTYFILQTGGSISIGNRIIPNGKSGAIYSGEYIELLPGFEIKAGAELYLNVKDMHCEEVERNNNAPEFESANKPTISERDPQSQILLTDPMQKILKVHAESEIVSVLIFDYYGRCVLQTESADISIGHLPPGMYIVRVYTADGQTLQSKFVHK